MKIVKKNDKCKFDHITKDPVINYGYGKYDEHWRHLSDCEQLGEIIWDDKNKSVWNVGLFYQPCYMYFLCRLIEVLYNFILVNNHDGTNKYFYGMAPINCLNEYYSMYLFNQVTEKNLIYICSNVLFESFPESINDAKGFMHWQNIKCSDLNVSIKEFEKIYEQEKVNISDDSNFEISSYKYKSEDLVKNVILCFEENKFDVPFDSKMYHSDSFQEIIAKANALREYAEDKGVLEPLSEEEKRPKYKVVPVEEAKL